MNLYKVPNTFYRDHHNRDCGDATQVVKSNKIYSYVALTNKTYDDLLSDADYYIKCGNEMGSDYKRLVASARSTKKVLVNQGAPVECWCEYIAGVKSRNQQTYVTCLAH